MIVAESHKMIAEEDHDRRDHLGKLIRNSLSFLLYNALKCNEAHVHFILRCLITKYFSFKTR